MTIRSANGKIYKVNADTTFSVRPKYDEGKYEIWARNILSEDAVYARHQNFHVKTFATFDDVAEYWLKIITAIKNVSKP